MPDEEAILEVAALIVDGVAVSEALLAGDVVEARFRAQMVAAHAHGHGMRGVQAAAVKVVRLLGDGSHPPLPGYAQAVLDLSEALDRVLARLRA
jgi:uncharacterized Ntn-hydrolase superfamily protein